jgi:SAM-dependent MidA family methyltransferase
LLAYAQHKASENVLAAPGRQDLTAHANFTALDLWGRVAGLARTGLVSQMQFIFAMGRGNDFADLYEPGASELDRLRARLMLKTLINPEGMGETFRVMVQHKLPDGLAPPKLTGLSGT